MKYPCDTVLDLLPLYHDGVCSDSSKQLVEKHLGECASCREVLREMENESYDVLLGQEADTVLRRALIRRKRNMVSLCLGVSCVLALIACFVCNLAVSHRLDWFFLVLASLGVFASVTLLPCAVKKDALLWTILGFTASLLLLLMTCCIYTGGDWFWISAVPSLFGLSLVCLPYILCRFLKQGRFSRSKGLIYFLTNTLLLYALIITCGLYQTTETYWRVALGNTTACVFVAWLTFLIIRYLPLSGLIKSGICTLLLGGFGAVADDIVMWTIHGQFSIGFLQADLLVWNEQTVNPNVYLIILAASVVIGLALITAGIWRAAKLRKSGETSGQE